MTIDLARRAAVQLDVHGVVVRGAEREVQDRLAVVVRRRAVLVVVEPADDHRRVDVAVQELDEHELADRGDARAPDPPGRDRHAAQHDAGVAQDDRAGVVVAVAVARRAACCFWTVASSAVRTRPTSSRTICWMLSNSVSVSVPLREQEQRRVAARLDEAVARAAHEPGAVQRVVRRGRDRDRRADAAFGAPGTSSRAVKPPSFALSTMPGQRRLRRRHSGAHRAARGAPGRRFRRCP